MAIRLLVKIDTGASYVVNIRRYGEMAEYLFTGDDEVAAACAQQIIHEGYHVEVEGQIWYYPVHRIREVIVLADSEI